MSVSSSKMLKALGSGYQALRRFARRGSRRQLLLLAGGIMIPVVGLCVAGANAVVLASAAPRLYRSVPKLPQRYAIIVLGARVNGDEPSTVLEDRLETALAVYRAGRGRRFLVSGDHGSPGYDEVRVMRTWLVARGVPAGDVFMDHAGFRTLDTMARAAQVFDVKDAIVVTQEFHLARSLYLAESMGIDAVGIVADRRTYEYAANYAVREALARAVCWFDVNLLRRQPRYLGKLMPLTGQASATDDQGER